MVNWEAQAEKMDGKIMSSEMKSAFRWMRYALVTVIYRWHPMGLYNLVSFFILLKFHTQLGRERKLY